MEDLDTILQERLDSIYEEFIQNLDNKLNEIINVWENARCGRSNSTDIEKIINLTHELTGTSASFNLFTIANRAYKLENFLNSLAEDNRFIPSTHSSQAGQLIQSLKSAVANLDSVQQSKANRWKPTVISPFFDKKTTLVYLLDTSKLWAEQITGQLEQTCHVKIFSNIECFNRSVAENRPGLIIADVPPVDNNTLDNSNLSSSYENNVTEIPVVFITTDNNIETRLAAVRSGSSCYFTLPLDPAGLLNKVKELTTGVPKDPYRIMVVDNDRPMAKFMAMVLEQEGMNITIVNDPLMTLDMIETSKPELILLNISMPGVSGLELTKIIRLEESYAGIAIVLFSSESSIENQLTAINIGGDEFISLPIEPDSLVATISSRVSRARTLDTMNYKLSSTLRELENQHFALNQHAIVSITNINGVIIYVNEKFCEISGYDRSELIGQDHNILNSGVHDDEYFKNLWSAISTGQVWQGEICNRKKNNDLYWLNTTIVPFIDRESRPYQYVSINSDITSKKLTELDLLKARDIAVNANQSKSEFLSKMSHELRTPLNAVLGFSQLLESSRDHHLSGTQLQYINEIHNAGNHLLHLINEVLDLSRIEANQLISESINIPLSAFLDECIALITPISKQNRLAISTEYENDLNVYADPLRLKQIIINLLSNAVKYNIPSGTIKIRSSVNNADRILIEVINTGEGISSEEIDGIFQPFTRLPQHKKIEGVGIGLALSRRLAELMGGKIGANSIIGGKTTFWVELTRADFECFEDLSIEKNEIHNEAPLIKRPATILYIEDNETNLMLVRELLADRPNYKLLHAYTISSGIELTNNQLPDIILMDLNLPDMNGFDGIHILKNNKLLNSIPVIAISAYADQESIQNAFAQGFEEYITKPIDVKKFYKTIEKYCQLKFTNKI